MRRFLPDNLPGFLGLLLFIAIAIVPIGASLVYAILYSTGLVGLLSDGLTGIHWAKLFTEAEIWASFGWSLYVAATTVVLTVGLALFTALVLRRPLAVRAAELHYLFSRSPCPRRSRPF